MDENKKVNQFSFLDFLIKLLRKRFVILGFIIVGGITAGLYAFLTPPLFITYSSVKVPSQQGMSVSSLLKSSGAASSLGALSDFAMPAGGGGDLDYLVAILESRTVIDSMIKKFDISSKLKVYNKEDLRAEFKGYLKATPDYQSQLLYIGVFDKNPKTAAEMTEYYVYLLNKVYSGVNSQAAKNNRENLEKRYLEVIQKLKKAEDSLKNYQQKYGIYSLEAQTEQGIKLAAEIKSKIELKEIEIGIQRKIKGNESAEVTILNSELEGLRKNYSNLTTGENQRGQILIPFEKTPEIGLNYYRLYRDVTIQGELAKVLLPVLEQARFQEQKESPSIVIIDKASIPEKKAKPQRKVVFIGGIFGGFGLGLIYALLLINLESIAFNNPDDYKKIQRIKNLLKIWKTDNFIE